MWWEGKRKGSRRANRGKWKGEGVVKKSDLSNGMLGVYRYTEDGWSRMLPSQMALRKKRCFLPRQLLRQKLTSIKCSCSRWNVTSFELKLVVKRKIPQDREILKKVLDVISSKGVQVWSINQNVTLRFDILQFRPLLCWKTQEHWPRTQGNRTHFVFHSPQEEFIAILERFSSDSLGSFDIQITSFYTQLSSNAYSLNKRIASHINATSNSLNSK